MEKVTVIGTGYVGLVLGAGLADIGHMVRCADIDQRKVDTLLAGGIPIYEPGLDEVVRRNVEAGRISFTTDVAGAIDWADTIFIAVGTPPGEDGSADLSHVLAVADTIGSTIAQSSGARLPKVVVDKSTVPVGTARLVSSRIASHTDRPVFVCSNPEFLKEGAAVADFFDGDRIVIGTDAPEARERLDAIYAPLAQRGTRIIHMDVESAEITKYAANSMLALRISFMNMIAQLCERVGADVESVAAGVGSDRRIGPYFLRAGCGYGGSCFPKDVQALIRTLNQHGIDSGLLDETISVNEEQKGWTVRQITRRLGDDLTGVTVGLWGLSFKPGTDDMREAPSIRIVSDLLSRGATVKAHDPVAMESARVVFGDSIEYCNSPAEAAAGVDALVLVTEWPQFAASDMAAIVQSMKGRLLIDGRNLFDRARMIGYGLEYVPVGRPAGAPETAPTGY